VENGGICSKHAVHIRPDLDLLGADASRPRWRGEIGGLAAERGVTAILVAPINPPSTTTACSASGGMAAARRLSVSGNWARLRVALVGDDHVARASTCSPGVRSAERERDNVAREALAIGRNGVDGRGVSSPRMGEAFPLGQFLEMLIEKTVQIPRARQARHLPRLARVKVAQVVSWAMSPRAGPRWPRRRWQQLCGFANGRTTTTGGGPGAP